MCADWFITSGDFEVLFRVLLGIFTLCQPALLSLTTAEAAGAYLRSLPEAQNLEHVLSAALAVQLEPGELMYFEIVARRALPQHAVSSVRALLLRPGPFDGACALRD